MTGFRLRRLRIRFRRIRTRTRIRRLRIRFRRGATKGRPHPLREVAAASNGCGLSRSNSCRRAASSKMATSWRSWAMSAAESSTVPRRCSARLPARSVVSDSWFGCRCLAWRHAITVLRIRLAWDAEYCGNLTGCQVLPTKNGGAACNTTWFGSWVATGLLVARCGPTELSPGRGPRIRRCTH